MDTTIVGKEGTASTWIQAASKAAAIVARRRHLSVSDAEDLRSELWLKLLEHDGAVMKKFEGRGALLQYLVAVADRCLLDRRVQELGKWRPSTRARAAGELAVTLERLTHREGKTLDEAIEATVLTSGASQDAVRRAAEAISTRRPDRRLAQLDDTVPVPCHTETPHDLLEAERRTARAQQIEEALRQGLARMDHEDLRLLTRRFVANETVATIAREEQRQQKALYRTYEGLCRRLRTHLMQLGVTSDDVRTLLQSAAS